MHINISPAAPIDATYLTQSANGVLTAEAVLTAGTNITLTPGAGILTIDAAAGGSSLPVVDETAIVYKTGNVAITQTHDINAYTVARLVTWPDAALTVAGLEVANVFTASQTMPSVRLTSTSTTSAASTLHAFQAGLTSSNNTIISLNRIQARLNGAVTQLELNPGGGAVNVSERLIAATLRATDIAAITLAGTVHALQTGLSNSTNIAIDTTSIQSRNNGAAATLNLNPLGGGVAITGLNIIPNPAYFAAGILSGLVLGYPGGSATENGALVSVARKNSANVPFVSFAGTDNGTLRAIYYGGGNWGATDATKHLFYTAPAYSETLNTGVLRMEIDHLGVMIKNASAANVFTTTFATGQTVIAVPKFDNGNATDIDIEYENTTSGYGSFNFRTPADNRWSVGASSPAYSGDGEGFWVFNSAGVSEYALFITPGSRVGIGNLVNSTILAQLHVNQRSTTAAIPVLRLRQADLSEEFIRFESTVGAGNPIDTVALGAYYGKVRVYVEGVGVKWQALYDT